MKPIYHVLWVYLAVFLINKGLCCVFLRLNKGLIKGRIATIPNSNKKFYAFQQIPYAAPPIGTLRFQPPVPVNAWDNILDTTKNTKICYQIGVNSIEEDEDCLYLNVYTPKLPSTNSNTSLPVMVFFHGGAFAIGDSKYSSYGPEFLVNHDVVIVTLNYRLGVFGFLSTQDEVIPGNNGLKDQLFALQWVNKNIHLFGGNSSEITIFGQSAGAASVGYHLVSKKSTGLYRAAIMESSSVLNSFGYQRNAKHFAHKIASYINASVTEESASEEILSVMLHASSTEIDKAADKVASEESYNSAQLFQGYFFAPVVELDSKNAFLTENMFEILDRGDANNVPVIIGINSEESLSQNTDVNFLTRLMKLYDNDLKALVPNNMNIVDENSKEEAGQLIRELYSGDDLLQNVPAAGIKYMSDTTFTRPVIKYTLLQSKHSELYFYQFSYDGKLGNISVVVDGTERVGHNEELAYLWRIQNEIFDNYDLSLFPESDITIQNRLVKLWTNFAKTLNPTPEKIDLFQNIIWPQVLEDNDFPYLNINENLQIKNYPKNDSFCGWERIYDQYGNRPYDSY
ncbi:juvenile hormone esterase-like [Tribolium madens]|uniref:juvenile hormone esterase-like n=1 Tax=Tribolium madens TaxID=41895 RepID=UPI001CF73B90|nr:juvenile hormone esterase-like [Tribolium madens]